MSDRKKVYEAIDEERDYQDSLIAKGTFEKTIKTTAEEILMIGHYADKARAEWTNKYGDIPALEMVRKIAALCVRCMENNGIVERDKFWREMK